MTLLRRLPAAALWLAGLAAGAAPAMAQRYQALLTENGHRTVLGEVRLDAESRLQVVSSQPRGGRLRQMAEETNAEDTLHLDAAPPAGAPRYADVTRPIPRSDPAFRQALLLHLRRYYDVTLREVGK